MAYGSEQGEDVRFKDNKPVFVLKLKIYIYVGLIFFHFQDHF
jgi:hypothetical protein